MSIEAPTVAAPATLAAPVAFEGVRVALGGKLVLDGVTLEVRSGELLGLVGPNGAGKSTLLRTATATVPLEAGVVRVEGADVRTMSRRALARRMAVVQQLPEAPRTMLVRDLVLLGRTPHLGLLERESAEDFAIARDATARAGCLELAERELGTLSGGQRKRVFIARALAQGTSILLLDEPTANLDPQAQAELCTLLRALVAEGITVLVVMHDLTLAAAYCDRVALLQHGAIVACGPPAEVLTPASIEAVYGDLVTIITHPVSGLPVLVPAQAEARHA